MGIIFFIAGGIGAIIVIYRFNQRAMRAAKHLEQALMSEGVEWDCTKDFEFRKKLFLNPSSILKGEDSAAVSSAKQELLSIRNNLPQVIVRAIVYVALGITGAIAAGLVSFYLKK